MHSSTRRPPPPWQRNRQAPVHPVGPAVRRFSASAAEPPVRYQRAFDGVGDPAVNGTRERRVSEGVRLPQRRSSAFDRMRRSPMKYGLVGMGVAGAATPLAIARSVQMRNDPSHERELAVLPEVMAPQALTEVAVGQAWREARAEVADAKVAARETVIQQKLADYKSYDVGRDLAEDIYDIALEESIDPDVAFGLVRTESSFKNSATSHVGAMGLTQLMPATAKWLKPGTTNRDLRDQRTNLRIGFKYLKQLIDRYDGDLRTALLAYNRGPGTVDRVLKRGGDPDNGYADMVLKGKGGH